MYDIKRFRDNCICVKFNRTEEIERFLDECRENNLGVYGDYEEFIQAIIRDDKVLACGLSEANRVKYAYSDLYINKGWQCINVNELLIVEDITPSKTALMEFLNI